MIVVPYAAAHPGLESTVAGDLRVVRGLGGRGPIAARDVYVLLPPGIEQDGIPRPVLYMHDGQNLFDDATSYVGEWGVDETAAELASAGAGSGAVIVGIPNAGVDRAREYSPWPDERLAPSGDLADPYLDYLCEVVAPAVARRWPLRAERDATGIAGSSLGGLISLYAALTRPETFGFCGALSPALAFGAARIFDVAAGLGGPHLCVHLDVGGREDLLGSARASAGVTGYVQHVRDMRALLERRGVTVRYLEDPEAGHDEHAWRKRFPRALAWFLELAAMPARR